MLAMFSIHFLLLTATLASWTEAGVFRQRPGTTKRSSGAQFDFAPFELTDLSVHCSRDNRSASYQCMLEYVIFDPNSIQENDLSSCRCNSTWSWYKGTHDCNTDYQVCCSGTDSSFEMRFDSFQNAGNLSLGIGHMYKDDQNFTPPYDHVITFVSPTLLLPAVKHNETYLKHYSAGPLYSNITSISD